MRASKLVLVIVVMGACAGCSAASTSGTNTAITSNSGPTISTSVVSVSSTSQLSDMVKWDATNKTGQPEFATCEVLVLNGKRQLGDYGPVQIAVAAGATAEEFSEVTTLSGGSAGDTAQIVCQKGLASAPG